MTTYVPQALILFLWYPKNKVPKSWWKKNNVYFKIKGYTTWAAGEKVGVSMETSPKMSPLGNRANFPNASEKQNMGWGSAYWTVTLSEASQRRPNIWYRLHVESKIWHKWAYLQNRNGRPENRLVVGAVLGQGWHGSSGLTDPNDYIKMDKQQGPTV